jgi:hypothetical protein
MRNGRCYLHGGASTGAGAHLNCRPGLVAMWRGRKAYIARRHALGLKAPGGRPRKLSADGRRALVAKALDVIEADLAALPAVDKPWEAMSPAEKLRDLTVLGLDKTRAILLRDIDYSDPALALKRERLVTDTALGLLARQIRVDEARYREAPSDTGWNELLARLAEEQKRRPAGAAIIDAEVVPVAK